MTGVPTVRVTRTDELTQARVASLRRLFHAAWPVGSEAITQEDRDHAVEDGYILVRLTPTTPPLDLGAAIGCEWHPGDVW